MTNAPTHADQAEVTSVEAHGRLPLLFLLAFASVWLVASGVFGLIASIQLHTPGFLAECSLLSYGHSSALAETSFVYGWFANAGLGLALWVLGRLGGEPLRGTRWAVIGTLFWNVSLAFGLVGIAAGHETGFALFQLPRYVDLILVFSYGAIALPGILAWTGRRRTTTFASQWYAVAALYLFPWLFTLAQVMLLWAPVRGVLQAVVAGWFAQGAWTLWLAPLALASAYYVVPRSTGRVLPGYEFAPIGFWTLLVIGSWTGGRHLIGGPVPAWIPTLAIVSCSLVLFHFAVAFLNLKGAIGAGSSALKFVAFGLLFYVLSGVADAVTAIRDVAVVTQFTYADQAIQQLALYGGGSLLLLGGVYFALPRLTGDSESGLAPAHLTVTVLGVALLVGSLGIAGWVQGKDLLDPAIGFDTIALHTRQWLLSATAAQGILLVGNTFFAVALLRSALRALCSEAQSATSFIRQPSSSGASAT